MQQCRKKYGSVSQTSLEDMPFHRSLSSKSSHATFPERHQSVEVCDDYEKIDPTTAFQEKPADKLPIRPVRKRLVEKNGQKNVRSRHIPRSRYALDIFTTIIDARWKWMIVFFIVSYVFTWTLCATLWWLIMKGRGTDKECFQGVFNWVSAFLYSIETQQTIGYGSRVLNAHCPEATLLLMIQTVIGMMLDAILLGLVFAKLARPNKRSSTILFSENATITKRDNIFCLLFQVADVRKRQLPEAHIRAYLYRSIKTKEGRKIPFYHESLQVGHDHRKYDPDVSPDRLFLLFPVTVVHIIDENSPFFDMTASDLEKCDWEVVVLMEGIVEATGCTLQARTSYLADEILWGNDFVDVVEPDDWSEEEGFRYDLFKMNLLSPVAIPRCSPKEFYEADQVRSSQQDENGTSHEIVEPQSSLDLSVGI